MNLTPELLRAAVAPVLAPVREALEAGIDLLPGARDHLGVDADPWFDAHVVRRVARHALERVAPGDGIPWSVDRHTPNSGVHLTVPAGFVRVARGWVGHVPSPGRNRSRQRYWAQAQSYVVQRLPFDGVRDDEGEAHLAAPLNLLLLWQPDGEFVKLCVAAPAGTWEYGQRAELLGYADLGSDDDLAGTFVGDDDAGHDLVTYAQVEEDLGQAGGGPG